MSRLEDRVWEELVNAHGTRLGARAVPDEPHRRPWSTLATGGALGLTTAMIVVVLAITGGTTPSTAFAVTDNHDGTVMLTIRELTDPAAVDAKLAQLGVRARVVPLQQNCPASLNMDVRYLQPNTQPWSQYPSTQGPVGSWTVGIIPARIPVGHTLVFGLEQTPGGWEMADAIVSGAGPDCSSREYLEGLDQDQSPSEGSVPSPIGGTTTAVTTTP
jgi:hypothetical protein